eukprot:Opistho-2@40517
MGATASTSNGAVSPDNNAGILSMPVEMELTSVLADGNSDTGSRMRGSMTDISVTSADLKPEHYKRGAAQLPDHNGLSLVFEDKMDLDAANLLQAYVRGYIVRKTGRVPRFRMRPNEDGNATLIQQRRRSSILPYTSALRMSTAALSRAENRRQSLLASEISLDKRAENTPGGRMSFARASISSVGERYPVPGRARFSVDDASTVESPPLQRTQSGSILRRPGGTSSPHDSLTSLTGGDASAQRNRSGEVSRTTSRTGGSRPGSAKRITGDAERTKSVTFGAAIIAPTGSSGGRVADAPERASDRPEKQRVKGADVRVSSPLRSGVSASDLLADE